MKFSALWLIAVSLLCACETKSDPTVGSSPEKPIKEPTDPKTTAKAPSGKEAVAASLKALDAWVAAQNARKSDAYLALYDAGSFRGVLRTASGGEQKLDFAAWKEQRLRMFSSDLTVAADAPKAVSWEENPGLGSGVVEVRFTQRWKSANYADHGPKILRFRVNEAGANIVYEELVKSSPGWDETSGSGAGEGGEQLDALVAGKSRCSFTENGSDYQRQCTLTLQPDGSMKVVAPGTSLNPKQGFSFVATGKPPRYGAKGEATAFAGCSGPFSAEAVLSGSHSAPFYEITWGKGCKITIGDGGSSAASVEETTATRLQGTWVSTDDPKSSIVFKGTQHLSVYAGKTVDTQNFTILSKTPDKGGAPDPNGKYLQVGQAADGMIYSIEVITDSALELTYLARGNTLSYRKSK